MSVPDSSTALEPRPYPVAALGDSMSARVARLQVNVMTRVADTAWQGIHALGAHRWREGWETDLERGWSRYRGSRCTICDEPWEGW